MEILKRLAPRTTDPTGAGSGGHDRLEPCDVAYGLAGLPPGPAALLRAVYALDHSQSNLRVLYVAAWQSAWVLTDDPVDYAVLRRLSARAVDALVYPYIDKCPRCNGTGHTRACKNNPTGRCSVCAGSGSHRGDDSLPPPGLDIDRAAWVNFGRSWYRHIVAALAEWDTQGRQHVRSRLRAE